MLCLLGEIEAAMAQLHVTRVKREFREIVSSEEVSLRAERRGEGSALFSQLDGGGGLVQACLLLGRYSGDCQCGLSQCNPSPCMNYCVDVSMLQLQSCMYMYM